MVTFYKHLKAVKDYHSLAMELFNPSIISVAICSNINKRWYLNTH